MILTYRYRVKNLSGFLNRQARAVNFVWNFCNDRQKDALKWGRKWLTAYDLNNLTSGSSKELGLHSSTINAICSGYVSSRSQRSRPFLRYRGKKSLGWIPVRGQSIKAVDGGFRFCGVTYRVFDSRSLPAGCVITDGSSFSQDSLGNWYLNVAFSYAEPELREVKREIGIDLGLKELAVFSDGGRIENKRHYKALENALGSAQRGNKKRMAKKIHAKIAATRRDYLHKVSTSLVKQFDLIVVGNVCASALAKTSMSKSVNDAAWSSFRKMLAYKAIRHGAKYEEVNESFSTRTCHECGSIAGPKGQTGLNERSWVCADCGTEHDRDVNAAINILRRSGHRAPAEGAACATAQRKCQSLVRAIPNSPDTTASV